MIIRCWGARGSIPVSGREFLRYGGDTTCLEIRARSGHVIIVDAGSGIRRLGSRLMDENRRDCAIIFTHAHWDHLLGFPFFKPIYQPDTVLEFYGYLSAQECARETIARTMVAPFFPVEFENLKAVINCHPNHAGGMAIGSITVESIPLSHPNGGAGYAFTEDDRRFVFLTDNELGHLHPGGRSYEEYLAFCRGADLLIHDAEFTTEEYAATRGWGHSLFTDALRLALEAKVRRFGLFHHNQEHPDQVIDAMVGWCRSSLKGVRRRPETFGVRQDAEFEL